MNEIGDSGILSRKTPALARFFWISDSEDWLAALAPQNLGGVRVFCRPEPEARAVVERLIRTGKNLQDYLGVTVDLAGKPLLSSRELRVWIYASGGKGGGHYWKTTAPKEPPAILSSATRGHPGLDLLRVNVHLTGPDLLFSRQRDRTLWFGLLVVASAAAALAGLVSAWRVFQRQLRLSEMKSNFVSSVSHELRAPIASVRLLAESLDRGKILDAQKQADYFRLIVQECRRLTSLIENVLDFSRMDQGRKQYELEPTDLGALLGQTVALMEPCAAERQVTLALAPASLQPATCNLQPILDARAIQQALVNLIDNAIKHSPAGATVSVGMELSLNHQPSTINLFVEDHGEGIPPAEHKKIFEPFYRRGSELRRETQGIGIGLTIVQHIVKAHGGRVTVRSEMGKGSRFTIELPLARTESTGVRT